MTDTLSLEAGDLLATDHPRRKRGLLLPYGETAKTNVGELTVEGTGHVSIPADPMVVGVNDTHARNMPVGRAVELAETPAGIVGAFDFAETPEGDAILADINEGRKTKLSAEITDLVIRGGKLISGRLYGAAVCQKGAFPSAGLLAADVGEDPNSAEVEAEASADDLRDIITELRDVISNLTDSTEPTNPPADPPTELAATSPEGPKMPPRVKAPMTGPATTRPRLEIAKPADLFAAIAQAHATRDKDLMAAIENITSASHTPNVTVPQWIQELWEGTAYERQYIPLFNHAELTSWKVAGWRWLTKPEVAKYAGDLTVIPSHAPTTEPVETGAERIAGGHKIDRKYKDFGDSAFIESYYRAMDESFAEVSDVDALEQALASAPVIELGQFPAHVPAGIAGVVRGYFAILRATRRRPTFALMSDGLYEELLYTRSDDITPYLEKLLGLPGGLDAEFLRPSVDLDDDQVFMGVKDAVTVHEMGGGAPIRVEAVDVSAGGEDHAVFGYSAVNIHREEGLALIDVSTGTPVAGDDDDLGKL